jgi:hypothetical protein
VDERSRLVLDTETEDDGRTRRRAAAAAIGKERWPVGGRGPQTSVKHIPDCATNPLLYFILWKPFTLLC